MSMLNVKDSSGNWKEIPSIGGYTMDEINTMLASKANLSHTHPFPEITTGIEGVDYYIGSSSGYITLPGGILIQWGTTAITSSSEPYPFSYVKTFSKVYSVVATGHTGTKNYDRAMTLRDIGLSGAKFKFQGGTSNLADARWIAIGKA